MQNVTYPNGATKTRSLNGQAQVRPSTLTTPTGKTWSINRQYYTPNPNDTVKYTTNIIGSLIYENIDRTFSYTYDGSGNISKIRDKTGTTAKDSTFVYDEAGQLIRENNAYTDKTVTYTYDAGGNILTKTEYPFTTGSLDGQTGTVLNYTYGNTNWKDLLTAYNGNAITYDAIGNPLTYYNGTQFTWERGRKLSNAVLADGTSISYKYNDSGIRTRKTVNGTVTDYFLDGSRIVAEKTGNNTTWYYYDGDGTREAIEYNGNVYYYFYNAQGDVVGLYDNNTNVVVNYTYDSWGNVVSITGSLASTLGQDNPFRYRGYYYDSETGLYYLNSRYYDANTGRFVNADGIFDNTALNGYNVFAYCMNNPVNYIDYNGNLGTAIAIIGIVVSLFTGWLISESANKTKEPTKITPEDAGRAVLGEVCDSAKVAINANSLKNCWDLTVEQRRQHAKNMVDASYAKRKKQSFSAKNINKTVFSSDEQYTEYCLKEVASFNQFIEASGISIRGKHWDDLSSEDQLYIEQNAILWDPATTVDIAKNNGTVTGFSLP